MFPEFGEGTFMWHWFHSWAGLNGMALALVVTVLTVGFTKWTPVRTCIKLVVTMGLVLSLPLGLYKMGVVTPSQTDQFMTYLNFLGATTSVGIGVPYLFHQLLRAASGRYSFYAGRTVPQHPSGSPSVSERPNRGAQNGTQVPPPPKSAVAEKGGPDRDPSQGTLPAAGSVTPKVSGETRLLTKPKPGLPWLVIIDGPEANQVYYLNNGNNRIGRDPSNDVCVKDPHMSRDHLIVQLENDKMLVSDLGSASGTSINGMPINPQQLKPSDIIRIGETELMVLPIDKPIRSSEDRWSENTIVDDRGRTVTALIVKSGYDSGKSFLLSQGDNLLGRDPDCNLRLSDDSVSRRHAVVRCRNGKLTLVDVGGKGGTELNGQQLGGLALNHGDVITAGQTKFRAVDPSA